MLLLPTNAWVFTNRGVATCTYMQKRKCVHFGTNGIEKFYPLDLCAQNVCLEAKLISLNPILTECLMILSSAPFEYRKVNEGFAI